ncbi:MAG: aa3-type cytochrome c oxidase subunit IV [Sphingomonadaceae bacterium]
MVEGGNESGKPARDNRQVYSGFVGTTKWVVLLAAIILILMAIFLV